MKKVILIDGNNLLFRSYYATAYSGTIMKNKKGFPTNALYGFLNMINKIVEEENPVYCLVAFDKGKTFRHEKYDFYKDGRSATPDDLKKQFPLAKKIIEHLGFKVCEIDNYEADDIIGTFAKKVDENDDFVSTIISSDKDLLQLISNDNTVKLLKTKDSIYFDKATFIDTYGIEPINIIDLKALMGDSSDNIKGVKGIGEKTALKLLHEYKTIDNLYENIENIKGSAKNKLIEGKKDCYESYEIATIYKDVELNLELEDIKIKDKNTEELKNIYEELEFFKFLKSLKINGEEDNKTSNELKIINDINDLVIDEDSSIYVELDNNNYHCAKILGISIYNKNNNYYIPYEIFKNNKDVLSDKTFYTYDYKKLLTVFRYNNIKCNIIFDTMIAAYLLSYNLKDDISYLAYSKGYEIYDEFYCRKNKISDIELFNNSSKKAMFIYETYESFLNELKEENLFDIYNNIEFPLAQVLSSMEYEGIRVDKKVLDDMGSILYDKIKEVENAIYDLAGEEFNIGSPKQLGEILFEKLSLPHGKKNKTGYSTDAKVLTKLKGKHEIIDKIMEYRTITKLYFTYIIGMSNNILDDNKIHTIYTQTLTRTGRLSSIEPNLQNIPIRYEEGRLIRKAFIPGEDFILLSSDYSQIELRVMAHISNCTKMIDAFKNDIDIHTSTASLIFNKDINDINTNDRRVAKAVNFGIIYGISPYGLAQNIEISLVDAKKFIDEYLNNFNEVKEYMDQTIKEAYKNGYITSLLGRKRIIDELSNSNVVVRQMGERIALNTPTQSLAADILKIAMINLYKELNKRNLSSKILLQVHDELILEVKKDELEEVKQLIKEVMENAYILSSTLKVDINIGDNWYEAK